MSNTFDFLSNISLGEDVKKTSSGGGGVKKQRNPENADLRVFATGAVYPSTALVTSYDLEYRNKGVEPAGNGFDIFKSTDWAITAKLPQSFIIIGAVPKNAGKVDLFDQVRYNDDGNKEEKNAGATPMTSVLEQGSTTFGKELLKFLKEVYGVTPNAEGFIDLVIITAHQLKTANDVYNIPKLIARGEKAGELSYTRRENIAYFPLSVAEGHVSAEGEVAPASQPEATAPAAAPVATPAEEKLPSFNTSEQPSEEEVPATANVDAPTLGELWGGSEETPEAPEEEQGSDIEL